MEEGAINLTSSIIESINHIFSNIFSSVDNGIYKMLDRIVFIRIDILEEENLIKLLGKNSTSGMILLCNSLFLGIFIFYLLNLLFSHLTYSKVQPPLAFIFKAIILMLAMNSSLWICRQVIYLISLISDSICEIGKELFHEEISFVNFMTKINDSIYPVQTNNLDVTSFDGIMKTFTTFGFMNLIFSYAIRYIMIQISILLIPFAILFGIYEKTTWLSKAILKVFISLLSEQILISLILVLSFSFPISNDLSKILYIGIIYSLMKANTYMYMIFGGITTSVTNNVGTIVKGGG